MVWTCIDWFLQVFGNITTTFYNLLTTTIDLSVVGLPSNTSLILVLVGGGLLTLIIFKLIMWLTPII